MPEFRISVEEEDLESQKRAIDHLSAWLRSDEKPDAELRFHINEVVSFSREVIGYYPDGQ